jgi:hypothetical protein
MLRKNKTAEEIAELTGCSIEEVRAVEEKIRMTFV